MHPGRAALRRRSAPTARRRRPGRRSPAAGGTPETGWVQDSWVLRLQHLLQLLALLLSEDAQFLLELFLLEGLYLLLQLIEFRLVFAPQLGEFRQLLRGKAQLPPVRPQNQPNLDRELPAT